MLLLHKGGLLDICFSENCLPSNTESSLCGQSGEERKTHTASTRTERPPDPSLGYAQRTPPWRFHTPLQDFLSGKRDNHYDLRAGLNNKHLGGRVTLSEVTEKKHTLTGSAVNLWMLVANFGHMSASLPLEQRDLLCHCSSRYCLLKEWIHRTYSEQVGGIVEGFLYADKQMGHANFYEVNPL